MKIATIPRSEIKRWTSRNHMSRKAWYNREPKAWCAWFIRPLQKLRHKWAETLMGTIVFFAVAVLAYAMTAQWLS